MGKKVLYTASTFRHLAAFHQPYLRWFAEQGYEVHAAAAGNVQLLDRVHRMIALPLVKRMTSLQNIRAMHQLEQLMQQERYVLVSTHTSLASFFTRMAVRSMGKERPIIINTSHGYLFDSATPWVKRRALLGAEQMVASVTDYVLTMNQQDTAIAEHWKLGRRVIETRGMGVDLSRFAPPSSEQRQNARALYAFAPEDIVLTYAAEFSPRKNQRMLIEALREMPSSIKLLLPGQGAQREACMRQAVQLGVADRVRFPGYIQRIEQAYYAADLCVSASRIEGLPFHVMEAMACGLPAVASAVKGHEDLIRHGQNGMLFPYNNIEAYCAAVKQCLAARGEMGSQAAKDVQRYALPVVFPLLTARYAAAAAQYDCADRGLRV